MAQLPESAPGVRPGPAGGPGPASPPRRRPAPASTAALLAGYVHAAGVRHVFGYPGESVIDFMEAARHRGIEIVSAVREGTAAFMAEAAAMATGRLGVCLSTLGPGSTAVLNGVASATLDRVPVLAISGQIESSREQFFTHQVVDHGRMFAPVSKLALRLDPASADTVIRKALRTAVAERPGAVHLTVTADSWPVAPGSGARSACPRWPRRPGSVDVLLRPPGRRPDADAERRAPPVILAGIAALRCAAGAGLVRLAELAGIPVVVSPMAKGVFPEDHPYFAGVLDMAGYRVVWDLLAGADLILAAGFDPVELISPWSVATPVLHLDTTPNTDQVYASAHELVGHVAAILGWLLRAVVGPAPVGRGRGGGAPRPAERGLAGGAGRGQAQPLRRGGDRQGRRAAATPS